MAGSGHGSGCTGPERAEALLRLASRTRELVDDLDTSRPELLSVSDLNRALKQVLKNQVAILESLAELPAPGQDLATRAAPRPDAVHTRSAGAVPAPTGEAPPGGPPRNGLAPGPGSRRALAGARPAGRPTPIAIRPKPPAPEKPAEKGEPEEADEVEVGSWSPTPAPEPPALPPVEHAGANGAAAPALTPLNGAAHPPTPHTSPAPDVVAAAEAVSIAETVLQESRQVPGVLARAVVELFDNRDKDYEKGLDKLNRWVAGGAGTPFQWRGDRAYLNCNAAGPTAVKNYEEQLMTRMGFSKRLGRLVVPGLLGEIVVYERPPG